jgi:hypothetical protein
MRGSLRARTVGATVAILEVVGREQRERGRPNLVEIDAAAVVVVSCS